MIRESPDEIIEILGAVQQEEKNLAMTVCPHCEWKWNPKYTDNPKWCPRCHRLLNSETKDRLVEKRVAPKMTEGDRFTPSMMKELVRWKLYSYSGIPKGLPEMTFMRERQRKANLALTDRFFKSPLTQSDFARAIKVHRAALFDRINRGFAVMLEHGCFRLTAKGRERVEQEKRAAQKKARKANPTSA